MHASSLNVGLEGLQTSHFSGRRAIASPLFKKHHKLWLSRIHLIMCILPYFSCHKKLIFKAYIIISSRMVFGWQCAGSFSSEYPFLLFLYACLIKVITVDDLILNTTCFPLCSNFGLSTCQSDPVSQSTCAY